jgi:hypothetical protein
MAARMNQESTPPVVFISHSHSDRDKAFCPHLLLKANGATTFLDQDEISGGDTLPQAIKNGVARCDKFLLIWSQAAAESEWVEKEWEAAFELKADYSIYLDSYILPDALQNFVYVSRDDEEHGHAELFRAVFGRLLENPKDIDIFPGHWVATVYEGGGTGNQGDFRLRLRSNGQVTGESQITKVNDSLKTILDTLRGSPYGDFGLTNLYFQRVPLRGTWTYTSGGGLRLKLVQTSKGQVYSREVTVHTSGKKKDALHGHDKDGNTWTLRRASDDEVDAESEEELDEE